MNPRTSFRAHRHGLRPLSLVVAVVVGLAVWLAAGAAFAATYDPLNIMSNETLRASSSMSQAEIQIFLDSQPSVLKSYSCAEGGPSGRHSTVVKRAAQIIFEAAQYWNVNPKLVLSTLEKEQSLISQPWHTGKDINPASTHNYSTVYHLTNAMGAGVYGGSTDRHPGFGDQVWTGTEKLGATTGLYAWYPGKRIYVHSYPDSAAAGPGADIHIWITPLGQPTWNFYTYTPYYPQKSVWDIYVRYFGDPLASPAVRPVYRFYRLDTGSHFYTVSEAERWFVTTKFAKTYRYEGVSYSVNTSNTANSVPLYRFCNVAKGTHFYTASEAEKNQVIATLSRIYRFEGPAYSVSLTPAGATPVYRFYNKRNATHFYTASEAEKQSVIAKLSDTYRFEGPAFYIAP
jgi:hypothetical protein